MKFARKKKDDQQIQKIGLFSDIMEPRTYIDTGSWGLNYILSNDINGGLSTGHIYELFGPESHGKSTVLYRMIASAQQAGVVTILVDSENAFDAEQCKRNGIDPKKLLYVPPMYIKDVFVCLGDAIINFYEDGNTIPMLIGWDSIAAASIFSGMDSMQSGQKGTLAAEMSSGLNKLNLLVSKYPVALVCVNQLRYNFAHFITTEDTPGGRALKFYAATRILIRFKSELMDGQIKTGILAKATTVKNKLHKPFKTCLIPISYDNGVENELAVVDLAKELDVMTQKGAYLEWNGERKYKAEWITILKDDSKLRSILRQELVSSLQGEMMVASQEEIEETKKYDRDDTPKIKMDVAEDEGADVDDIDS